VARFGGWCVHGLSFVVSGLGWLGPFLPSPVFHFDDAAEKSESTVVSIIGKDMMGLGLGCQQSYSLPTQLAGPPDPASRILQFAPYQLPE
jgi:hypothetical protein